MTLLRLLAVASACAALSAATACRGALESALPGRNLVAVQSQSIAAPWSGTIKHVVIVYQENRTVDNLFSGFPGADTQTWGLDHHGQRIRLLPVSERAPFDIDHSHRGWTIEYAGGRLNGFDLVASTGCNNAAQCPPASRRAYAIVPRGEVGPYFEMARQFGFGDRMFQSNEGPSFPSHQYIISGTSSIANNSVFKAAENPKSPTHASTGGCDSPQGATVQLIDPSGNENREIFPCFNRLTLMDLLEAHHVSWRWYQEHLGAGLWSGPDAISHIRYSPSYRNVRAPSAQVLQDILNGDLASVTWIMPAAIDSDHASVTDGSGPSWVAAIVNAIGTSPFWNDTVVIVTWDDWGGWYDHVNPPQYNSYELGFRVPLIVIAPYAKRSYVSHQQHEFGSILRFIEETFRLGSLGTTDSRSDDLSDFFNFGKHPRAFDPIHAPVGPRYFLSRPGSGAPLDDDY